MPATSFPDEPQVPDEQRGSAPVPLRYEDVAQDARLSLNAIPQAIGAAVWRTVLRAHAAMPEMRAQGILPVLSRLVVVAGDGPCAVEASLDASGLYAIGTGRDAAGNVERLYLNIWATLEGPRGRTFDPQPERAGERQLLGRVFGEHVFTRPFAPPAERKVVRLALPRMPAIPPDSYIPRSIADVLAAPAGAVALEVSARLDAVPFVFGLSQTDSNQHVNSLVYPRLFEEAVVRRLSEHGVSKPLLAREVELLYRKPSFAGEQVRIVLRTFREGARYLATGVFIPESAAVSAESLAAARPLCAVRMALG